MVISTTFLLAGCTYVPAEKYGISLDSSKKIVRIEVINIVVPINHITHYVEHTDQDFSKAMDIVQNMMKNMQLKKQYRLVANKAFIINIIYDDGSKLSLTGLNDGKLYEEVMWFEIDGEWYKSNLMYYDYLVSLYQNLHKDEQTSQDENTSNITNQNGMEQSNS